jgi:hypothetical protein
MPSMVRCMGRATAWGSGFPQLWQAVWPAATWTPQLGQAVMARNYISNALYDPKCRVR